MPDSMLLPATYTGNHHAPSERAVLTACPVEGDVIPTGLDVSDMADLEPSYLLVLCPACGADHAWTPEAAWLGPR